MGQGGFGMLGKPIEETQLEEHIACRQARVAGGDGALREVAMDDLRIDPDRLNWSGASGGAQEDDTEEGEHSLHVHSGFAVTYTRVLPWNIAIEVLAGGVVLSSDGQRPWLHAVSLTSDVGCHRLTFSWAESLGARCLGSSPGSNRATAPTDRGHACSRPPREEPEYSAP